MTRQDMEQEAAQLLLEQRRLARLGLTLGPAASQRLKSLLLRLGFTRMSRRNAVRRYAQPSNYSHEDFVRKIAENPKDATNSLVYADWLEENGMPTFAGMVRQHVARHDGQQGPHVMLGSSHHGQTPFVPVVHGEQSGGGQNLVYVSQTSPEQKNKYGDPYGHYFSQVVTGDDATNDLLDKLESEGTTYRPATTYPITRRNKLSRRGAVRRYTIDLSETIRQGIENSRRRNTGGAYTHDTTAGKVVADAMEEAGEPHAPFFRNLVPRGSWGFFDTEHGEYTPDLSNDPSGFHTSVDDGGTTWGFRPTIGRGDPPPALLTYRNVRDKAGGVTTSHTGLLHAPALREWASHPKVGPSLRAALVNAADHLDSHEAAPSAGAPPERMSRRSVVRRYSHDEVGELTTKINERHVARADELERSADEYQKSHDDEVSAGTLHSDPLLVEMRRNIETLRRSARERREIAAGKRAYSVSRRAVVSRYARITLSPPTPRVNTAGSTINHHDLLDERGAKVGKVHIIPRNDGRHLHVDWVGAGKEDTGNVLGPEAMRTALRSLAGHYPDAEFVSGFRSSGFRAPGGAANEVNANAAPERTVVAMPGKGRGGERTLRRTAVNGQTPTSSAASASLDTNLEPEGRVGGEMKPRFSRRTGKVMRYSADAHDVHALLGQLSQPEHADHMAGHDDPLGGLRGIAADALDEQGRGDEATLLRTPGTHVEVRHDGTVKPSFMERQGYGDTYGGPHTKEQFVKPSYSWNDEPGNEHHSFGYWFAQPYEDGTGDWLLSDGEGLDPEDVDGQHPNYRDYPRTQDLVSATGENHPMSPSELAWMHRNATTSAFRLSRRGKVVRYAKAERERHPAHPLIAGFPLEFALRHLSNDGSASPTLRDTAKHVLTSGDTSGLWGINDLVQQHENVDGTTGHPILKAGYNFMSAADKVQLDGETHLALKSAADASTIGVHPQHHSEWVHSPEYHAIRAARGMDKLPAMTRDDWVNVQNRQILARVREHVKRRNPEIPDHAITESIRRHAYRGNMAATKRATSMGHEVDVGNALKPLPKKGGSENEKATRYSAFRYRRKVVVRFAKPQQRNFIDALRRMQSRNHTALTDAATSVAQRMGISESKVFAALHDGQGGAVPGVAQAVYGAVRPESVHALAAWVNGLLPDGPGYAVFHTRPNGPDTLYRMRHEGSGMDIRAKLDRAGITSRVMIPHRKGFDVLIPDKGNAVQQNVSAYAEMHGLHVEASAGHFQTVGSADQGQARATMRNKVVAGERPQQNSRRGGVRRYGKQRIVDAWWMDPRGELHELGDSPTHEDWLRANKSHPLLGGEELSDLNRVVLGNAFEKGWLRVMKFGDRMTVHSDERFPNPTQLRAVKDHAIVHKTGEVRLVGPDDEERRLRMARSSPSFPKRYAAQPHEEWIHDFKVPVYDYDMNDTMHLHYYAPKKVGGKWSWNLHSRIGSFADDMAVKEQYPHALSYGEMFAPGRRSDTELTPHELHLATDGREGSESPALSSEVDYRPSGTIPEDYYAMSRRSVVKRYAKIPESEQGVLNPEQLAIAQNAYENADHTGWGALGDHLQENGFPNAGSILSRVGSGDSSAQYIAGGGARLNVPAGSFQYRTYRDGSALVHHLQLTTHEGQEQHVFRVTQQPEGRRPEPTPMSRVSRRRVVQCR